ncbi:hypothetical protein [Agrobacterium sp. lyk4-40-TYG-31]|uniref:hypothetical protein n=1 Tax=Agrobacterium sp. lyk4-40-TYG-31 TaxID=3040276 RepID=UPI002551009F|nr:hypothetical protein [Agrobacterium sp. lyk4-40-TYG-31]
MPEHRLIFPISKNSSPDAHGKLISIVMSSSGRRGGAISKDVDGGEIESGAKLVAAEAFRSPLRYSRRQRVNSDRDNP